MLKSSVLLVLACQTLALANTFLVGRRLAKKDLDCGERKNFEWNSREAKRPSSSTRGWECCRNRLQRQSEGYLLEQRGPATRRTADAAWSFSVTPNTLTGAGWYQQDIRFKDWFEGPSGIQPALLDLAVKSHGSRKFQVFLPRRQKGVWTSS